MKRWLCGILVAVLTMGSIAGCGSGTSESDTSDAGAEISEDGTEAAESEVKVLMRCTRLCFLLILLQQEKQQQCWKAI